MGIHIHRQINVCVYIYILFVYSYSSFFIHTGCRMCIYIYMHLYTIIYVCTYLYAEKDVAGLWFAQDLLWLPPGYAALSQCCLSSPDRDVSSLGLGFAPSFLPCCRFLPDGCCGVRRFLGLPNGLCTKGGLQYCGVRALSFEAPFVAHPF